MRTVYSNNMRGLFATSWHNMGSKPILLIEFYTDVPTNESINLSYIPLTSIRFWKIALIYRFQCIRSFFFVCLVFFFACVLWKLLWRLIHQFIWRVFWVELVPSTFKWTTRSKPDILHNSSDLFTLFSLNVCKSISGSIGFLQQQQKAKKKKNSDWFGLCWMLFDIRFSVHFFSHLSRSFVSMHFLPSNILSLCVFFLRSWMLEWICLFLHRVPVTPRKYVQNNSVIQDVAGLNHDLFIGKWKNDSRRRIYTHWTGSNLIFQFSVAGNAHSNTKPLIAILHND